MKWSVDMTRNCWKSSFFISFIPLDNESVIIRRAFKVCDSQGYGLKVTTSPRDLSSYDVSKRCVVCLDALDYSEVVVVPPEEKIPKIDGVNFVR